MFMNKLRSALILSLMLVLAACEHQNTLVDESPDMSVADLSIDAVAKMAQDEIGDADRHMVLFTNHGVPGDFAASVEAMGGTVEYSHAVGFAVVSGLTGEQADQIGSRSDVSQIEADESFALGDPGPVTPEPASIASPNDPASAEFFPRQWNMRAIGADQAWAAGKLGDAGVTIAILDTGIDYEHPDLIGLVDLSRSISFEPLDDFFTSFFFPGKHPVTDLHFHGTHVAATAVSNAVAAAGVSSQTTLMGVKVCSFLTFACSFSGVMSGILHAADNGADIVNMSLGGGFSKAGNGEFVGFINRVFNYARQNAVTMVVAAGNAATDLDQLGNVFVSYCDAPHTLCVSATGPTAAESINGPWEGVDELANYSNFGRSAISVAAPGGRSGVIGTNDGRSSGLVYAACSQTSLLIPICSTGVFIVGITGTSMASPHVAGLAGLVAADIGTNPAQIKAAIEQGADDLGQPGLDKFYGRGRINVAGSLGL